MAATQNKPLNRKGVLLPSPEIKNMTIDEIVAEFGDPAEEGQDARFGQGSDTVAKLWTPESLADEIHNTSQASMLSEVNIEVCTDKAGKRRREDGNRTILALRILAERYGTEGPVKVVTEGEVENRTVRYTHEKNYGVKFPVKDYGVLTDDQRAELRLKRQRARKDLSNADYIHAACALLESYPGEMPEKLFVKRMGAETILHYYPQGLEKDEKTGEWKIKNRQGPIQDPKRLMKLPRFLREAYLAGLAGIGPKIPAKKLTTLLQNWEADEEASSGKVTTEMSREEVADILPESELLHTLDQIKASSGTGRGQGSGVMSAKDLDGFAKFAKGSRIVSTTAKFVMRAKGHVGEKIGRALLDVAIAAEKALGHDHPVWKALDEAIASTKAEASVESDEASDEAE